MEPGPHPGASRREPPVQVPLATLVTKRNRYIQYFNGDPAGVVALHVVGTSRGVMRGEAIDALEGSL